MANDSENMAQLLQETLHFHRPDDTILSYMTSCFQGFSRGAFCHVLDRGIRNRANFFQKEIGHMMHQMQWTEVPIIYTNDNVKLVRSSICESLVMLWKLQRERRSRH